MALGVNRGNVVGLVLRGASALIPLGLIVGLPLTFAAGKFLGSQLYGISPSTPWQSRVVGQARGTFSTLTSNARLAEMVVSGRPDSTERTPTTRQTAYELL